MTRATYDAVVVGGGIAGLTAGWTLRHQKVLVLEASERVGGRLLSTTRGPYWLNLGAHLFGGPGSILDSLVTEMNLETRPIPGNRVGLAFRGQVVTSGRPETYPLRLPISLAGRLSFIRAGLRLRSAARGYLKVARSRAGESHDDTRARALAYLDNESFADWLGDLHPDVERIFKAIAERITAEPAEISAGCGAALFALVWGDKKTLARNLIGGSALLPEALAHRLGDKVLIGALVQEVARAADGVTVRFLRDGVREEVSAKYVVVATPSYVTRSIVRDLPQDTADALERIPYGPFVCGAFLTDEVERMPWDDLYALAVVDKSFNMMFNHANPLRTPGKREPGGSLMVYAGGDLAKSLLILPDREIDAQFRRDLEDLFPDMRGIIREVLIKRWERAIPYAAPGRALIQPALKRPLGRVLLAGDYLEFPEMEAAAATGLEAAQDILTRLPGNA